MARTYTRKKLVTFSQLEWELLGYLARGEAAQNVVRDALRALARQDASFDIDAFAKHLSKNVMPKMDERQREALRGQLDELRRTLAGEFERGKGPTIDDDHIQSSVLFGR